MTDDERAWATGVWRRYCRGSVINAQHAVMCRGFNDGDTCASRERPYTLLTTPAEPTGHRAEARTALQAWEAALPSVMRASLVERMRARREANSHAT